MKNNTVSPQALLLPWIQHQTSLTQKLYDETGDAKLQVLQQQWAMADEWDKNQLHIKCDQVFKRQIVMLSQQKMCWYARTIIPKASYDDGYDFFIKLKQVSLGQLLFGPFDIIRTHFEYAAIDQHSLPYQWLSPAMTEGETVLWMRQSTFQYECHSTFYLMEILLPGLSRLLS